MSRIDELIQQLCPDGVEYKPLGDIVNILDSQRKPISKGKRIPGKIPYYGANGIQGYVKDFIFDGIFLLIGEDGSVINKDGSPVLNWAEGKIWVNNHAHILTEKKDIASLRFIFFFLQTYDVTPVVRGTPPKMTQQNLREIMIPVPPLSVQKEIVRILDKFTALEAELEAELEARRKQYEFYRDQLLNFKGLMSRGAGSLVSLGDLFDFKNGLNKSKEFFGSGYPIVNFTDVFKKNHLYATDLKGRVQVTADEISRYSVQKGDVFFTRTSETREEIGMASVVLDDIGDCVFSGFVLRARPKTTLLLPQYCGFCFRHNDVRKQIIQRASFTTRALTSGTALAKIQIPVPPLTEQERIVAILDKFDALVNDISSGLPAELEMRRKQYEYYRDRLLTFKPLAKEA